MASPTFEIPTGAINGVNRVFFVAVDYRPGTPRVWLNGLLLVKFGQDGWTEEGGRKLRLHEAPRTGDTVQVYYTPIA